jgi:hypothetical protein
MSTDGSPFAAVRGLRPDTPVPPVWPVRQRLDDEAGLEDVAAATAAALEPLRARVAAGDRVAVTAGSRGITDKAVVVRACVDWLRSVGAEPFVVPAMGSHGGATVEGQLEVLADLGITETSMGAPIRATLETVVVGNLPDGTPVHHDRFAAEADGVVLVNRIKPHTDFHGDVESGLGKIAAIGLGNHVGAQTLHAGGIASLEASITAAARVVVAHGRILGGLGIVENARERTSAVELVGPDDVAGPGETALLRRAASLMGRLPFDDLDVLVVDEHGKDKSGTGMDTNVLGRVWIPGVPEPESPRIAVVTVHHLTAVSHGNAAGIGLADVMPLALLDAIDVRTTYVNGLTSGAGGARRSRLPMVLEDDDAVVRAAVAMCGRRDCAQVRLARIHDTLTPGTLMVTPALLPEVEARPDLEVVGEPAPITTPDRRLAPWPDGARPDTHRENA